MLLRSYYFFLGFFCTTPLLVHVETKLVHVVPLLVLGDDFHFRQPIDQSLHFAELLVAHLDSCLFRTGDANVAYLCEYVVECVRAMHVV